MSNKWEKLQVNIDSSDNAEKDGREEQPSAATAAAEDASKQKVDKGAGPIAHIDWWLKHNFPGHEYAVSFGFLGLITAILLFLVGFWRTLLVVILVTLGVAIGQKFDGDPKIFTFFHNLFRSRDER